MLGRFLEFSVTTADIGASLEFYGKLGFTQAQVGDAWPHPYAVLTDGRICLGLHQQPSRPAPSLTFVKPELLKHLDELERLGAEFEFRHLGNDVFNEVGWLDPSGHLIRLLEARTFSPVERGAGGGVGQPSLCGYFLEIALPTGDRDRAKEFWERFGFVAMDEPDAPMPHITCTSDSIDIGLYPPSQLSQPALLFETPDLKETLAQFAVAGVMPNGRRSMPPGLGSPVLLTAPEGTSILVVTSSY